MLGGAAGNLVDRLAQRGARGAIGRRGRGAHVTGPFSATRRNPRAAARRATSSTSFTVSAQPSRRTPGPSPVMGEHDCAVADLMVDRREHVGGAVAAPVVRVGAPAGQQQIVVRGQRRRPRRLVAPRGAPAPRSHAEPGEAREGTVGVGRAPGGVAGRVAHMLVAMKPDRVALVDDPPHQLRVLRSARRHDEERGACPVGGQRVEDPRCPPRVGSVVKGQGQRRHVTPELPVAAVGDTIGGSQAGTCCGCLPSANSSTIFEQNAGRSSGLRLETRPSSCATSSSTQLAPALRMSVCRLGQDVIVRPVEHAGLDERPRAVADHADRLVLLEERAHESHRALVGAQRVGVGDSARQHEAVVVRPDRRRRRRGRSRTCRPCRGG